jgi:membrane-anchored protein YejM (alkaline phosphatase superfamily)
MQELTIKQKLTNYYYFVIFNCIIAVFISIAYWHQGPRNYCMAMPTLTDWISWCYIVTTHFINIAILVAIAGLIALPTIYFKSKKKLIIQSIIAIIFIAILIFDVGVYHADRMHFIYININHTIKNLTSKYFIFQTNRIIAYIGLIIFGILIYQINKWINKTNWLTNSKIGSKFAILFLSSIIISQMVYTTSSKKYQKQLSTYVQYLPININGANIIKQEIASNYKYINTGKLQYPLKPLQITEVTNPPNILIIAMDAWRADCFNEIDSPNLWQFAQCGTIFTNHKSAANHTGGGLFGLFYGIPASYSYICKRDRHHALIFSRLKNLYYNIKFFTSDDCMKDFIGNKNYISLIRNENEGLYNVDKKITQYWLDWYNNLDNSKPWFSFVFYDSLHGPDFPEGYLTTAQSRTTLDYKKFAKQVGKAGFINSYKTSVHYIDSLANKILTKLKKTSDLANTIVIITADHGCEWDDNNQGQWGYLSNFTDCQIQVPFAIILPKQFQGQLLNQQNNLTTHYDVVPTLMYNFLGVYNDITDYSIGNDLLHIDKTQEWSLAISIGQYGSYSTAIIEKNKTLQISPGGMYNLIDNLNCLLFNETVTQQYLNKALECMTRFIKK